MFTQISRSGLLVPFLAAAVLEAPDTAGPLPSTARKNVSTQEWYLSETANFSVHYHAGEEALARQAGEAAERTRSELYKTWFGRAPQADWHPKCNIFLHWTERSLAEATENRGFSAGYASTQFRDGRVVDQRIDLLVHSAGLLRAVLPHELAHAVMADHFGQRSLPLWADEGIAVLAETPEKRLAHAKNLERSRLRATLYPVQQLMTMTEYPNQDQLGQFYAQSADLVEFLVQRKGAAQFLAFISAAHRYNYEHELNRSYGFASFIDLEQEWRLARSGPVAVSN